MTKPLGFTHTRIDGRLRAVWPDGTVTPPIIRGGDEGEESNPAANEKTFTQADLDRIVQERLARVKAEPPADYDDLKKAAERLAEIEAANATDIERAQKAAQDAAAEAEQLRQRVATFEAQELTRKQREQIIAAAKDTASDPEVVADLLLARNAVTLDDAGQVTDADTAVKALLDATPSLAKAPAAPQRMGAGVGRGSGADVGSVSSGRERYLERHGKNNP